MKLFLTNKNAYLRTFVVHHSRELFAIGLILLVSFLCFVTNPAWGQISRLPDPQALLSYPSTLPASQPSQAGRPPFGAASYLDLDAYLGEKRETVPPYSSLYETLSYSNHWSYQVLPDSSIYRSYLAGAKESRMSGKVIYQKDSVNSNRWLLDGTLGARFGLLRYGTTGSDLPQGFQVDIEGSAQIRLDIPTDVDVRSTDYRVGLPLTFGYGNQQTKIAYYHLSSHLADEFIARQPTFPRVNFARDVIVLGHSIYLSPELRIYAEAGWAFFSDVSEPWEFQFGLDWAPAYPTGPCGAPFFAVNGHLREEVDFNGNFTVQTGWAWRADHAGHLLRVGLHYFHGKSNQFSFFDHHETQLGLAMWYDF